LKLINIFTAKFIAILFSFIFSIVLANTLSQHYVGVYLTGFTLMSAISIFIRSGFDKYLMRINAESADKFSNYCNLSLLTFIPYMMALSVGIVYYIEQQDTGPIFLLFIIAAWCKSHFGVTAAHLQSLGKIKLASIVEISLLHLLLIVTYLFLPIQIDLNNSVVIFLIASVFLSFFIFFLLHLDNRGKNVIWKLNFKKSFTNSFSIMLTDLLDFLVFWLPSFILFSFATTETTAQFQIALRISFLVALPLVVINSISSPIIALYIKRNLNSKLSELLQISSLFGTILSIVSIVFLLIFKDMIFSFFGDDYIVENSVLMLLLFGHLINVLSGSVGRILTLSGNGWVHFKNSIIAIILSIIMALFLIPQNFIIGAAISTSLAIIIKNLLGVFYVHRLFGFISLPNRQAFSNLKIKRINEILSHRD
jgi:O-antigen/teichoic acid export membrane protein